MKFYSQAEVESDMASYTYKFLPYTYKIQKCVVCNGETNYFYREWYLIPNLAPSCYTRCDKCKK